MIRTTTIAEIAAPAPRSIAIGPFGSALRADRYTSSGIPVVRGQNIGDRWGLSTDDVVFVAPETAAEFPACVVRPGDLVFPHRGAIGRVARVDDQEWLLSSSMMKLTVNPEIADSRFVLLYFRDKGRDELLSRASTVGTPGIGQPLASLRSISIPLPSLPEQQAIAEVLGALDDKIAANTALAATSDALIRAEYAALNVDRVRVADVAESPRSGVDPSSVNPQGLYVGLEHVGRRHMWLTDGGRAEQVGSTKSRFQEGDILFGKLRPYFHKVVSAPQEGICSTDILAVRARNPRLSSILLAALTSDNVIEQVVAASEGTRMPRTSWKDLAAVEIPWPDASAAGWFAARLDEIRAATLAVLAENRTLAATRDALLPHLMSGKLRVRDAEAAASEAGA